MESKSLDATVGRKYYLSYLVNKKNLTGREKLSALHQEAFLDCCEGSVYFFEKIKLSPFKSLFLGLQGWLDGLNRSSCESFISQITKENVDLVYIDGSNYGRVAKEIKLRFPEIKIVTFFHNVECYFFWHSFRNKPSLRGIAVFICNYIAERMAFKYSDTIVCLNERDGVTLNKIYGQKNFFVMPLCVKSLSAPSKSSGLSVNDKVGLFVGGAFYANLYGVKWFVENVVRHTQCRFYIVGVGFEEYRSELEVYENIRVVGEVDDLSEWYARCDFIFSPIFDGSGMKTKTAEALSYGKPILGTPESFVGYENHLNDIGKLCVSASDFIKEINDFNKEDFRSADSLIDIFSENYSFESLCKKMKLVLE